MPIVNAIGLTPSQQLLWYTSQFQNSVSAETSFSRRDFVSDETGFRTSDVKPAFSLTSTAAVSTLRVLKQALT
jgi:hypothetical protein